MIGCVAWLAQRFAQIALCAESQHYIDRNIDVETYALGACSSLIRHSYRESAA